MTTLIDKLKENQKVYDIYISGDKYGESGAVNDLNWELRNSLPKLLEALEIAMELINHVEKPILHILEDCECDPTVGHVCMSCAISRDIRNAQWKINNLLKIEGDINE
jgi:hypothetical protein